jgi:hypothetical protein
MAVYKRGENWYIDLSLRVRESGSPWGDQNLTGNILL